MRSGGLYFRFFHCVLLVCLLIGSIFFGYAIVEVYKPDLMVPGVAWYYFGVQPGFGDRSWYLCRARVPVSFPWCIWDDACYSRMRSSCFLL